MGMGGEIHRNLSMNLLYFMPGTDFDFVHVIFIITITINISLIAWVDVLHPSQQFSTLPGLSQCFLGTKPVL